MLYWFDENKERQALMFWDEGIKISPCIIQRSPDHGKPKPGITRAMLEEFYARKNAVQTVERIKYTEKEYPQRSMKDVIDDIIKGGYTIFVEKPFGRNELHHTNGVNIRVFSTKLESDYIKTVLNKPSYWELIKNEKE